MADCTQGMVLLSTMMFAQHHRSSQQNSQRNASAKQLPVPPSLLQTIGPSFILVGLAMGSGELILWPYLVSQWGLGIVWGGLVGITFQYFLNTEAMRYTLAWGESVFVGFRKLSRLIPFWFVLSTYVPWSIPGLAVSSAVVLAAAAPPPLTTLFSQQTLANVLTIALLLLSGLILTLGKTLQSTMEWFQRTAICIALALVGYLVWQLAEPADFVALGQGFLGQGEGYRFIPPGIAMASFLGAFAYSGAGGNLNLAQSYYIKEKGFGMGAFAAKITSILYGKTKTAKLEGGTFAQTAFNTKRWQAWWWLICLEHGLVFWGLGLLLIASLSLLAYITVGGQSNPSGLLFLFHEAEVIGQQLSPSLGRLFLTVGGVMLFATQVGIYESSSRIISENILLITHRPGSKVNSAIWFYGALWAQICAGMAVYILGIREPRLLLTVGAVLNAMAMFVSFGLLLWLNTTQLHRAQQPHWPRRMIIALALGFFGYFIGVTVGFF